VAEPLGLRLCLGPDGYGCRADSTIAVRRNGAGSGADHFRLAHLRFALMMTARAQPTTGRGGADGGDGG